MDIKSLKSKILPFIVLTSIGSGVFLRLFIKTPLLLFWVFSKKKKVKQ